MREHVCFFSTYFYWMVLVSFHFNANPIRLMFVFVLVNKFADKLASILFFRFGFFFVLALAKSHQNHNWFNDIQEDGKTKHVHYTGHIVTFFLFHCHWEKIQIKYAEHRPLGLKFPNTTINTYIHVHIGKQAIHSTFGCLPLFFFRPITAAVKSTRYRRCMHSTSFHATKNS